MPRKNPDFKAHRFNYAGALRHLGLVQRDRGATADAIRAFRQSLIVYEGLADDQRDPKQSLGTASDLGLALAADAKRSGSASARSAARAALQHAIEGWQAYQRGAGAKEDHQKDVDALSAALREVDRMAGGRP